MTRGVRVRASTVIILKEVPSSQGPSVMYAYRCAPLCLCSASGVASHIFVSSGTRACCELLPRVVCPNAA